MNPIPRISDGPSGNPNANCLHGAPNPDG
jgi:hypothetical protein